MKIMRYFIMTLIAAVSLMAVSCINDTISSSSSDTLTFSRDTVNFDTVFTDLGTPTARLIVHNRAKKGIEISSIKFRDPDTRFRLNVDGVSGVDFHDVEIRAKDSIYVFIEAYLPATQGNVPQLVADDLEFVTNGVTQTVRVEAYGQNVTRLRDLRVTADTRLTADRPYVIFGDLRVEAGATLTIEPGARLLFHDKASLTVDGRLEAVGAPGKMIDFRGDRIDNVLPNVGYDVLAGQWKGVTISAGSFDNRIEYVNMRSTVQGLVVDSCADLSRQKLTIRNSWLHNSQGNAFESKYAKVDAYGVCFSEAAGACVELSGGSHRFVQCTFANNYLFSAIYSPLVNLIHCLPEEAKNNPNPLMQANFENSIIYGLAADIEPGDLKGSQVFFDYVSLKSKGDNDANFRNCLWETDPLFYTDRPIYYFNYRLQPDSPVKSAGNPAFVGDATITDMDGINRLSDGNPSLVAYQFYPEYVPPTPPNAPHDAK